MNKKCIIVGGSAYADIDVLACIAAYVQLLTLKGHQAQGIITGPWNQTIPRSVRQWKTEITQITEAKEVNRYLQVAQRLWLRKEILREFLALPTRQ